MDADALAAALDELVHMAQEELRGWADLRHRASDSGRRLQALDERLQSANTQLDSAVVPGVTDLGVVNQRFDAVRATVRESAQQVTRLLTRASSLLAQMETGAVAQSMQQLDAAAAETAGTLTQELDELSDEIAVTGNDLLEEMPELLKLSMQSLAEEMSALGTSSRDELAEVITKSMEEFEHTLSEVVETSCRALELTADELSEEVESVAREASADIEELCGKWHEGMSALESTYGFLGDDIKRLAEDISSIYSLVVDGMNSTSVGASSAGAVLSDAQAVMSTVS